MLAVKAKIFDNVGASEILPQGSLKESFAPSICGEQRNHLLEKDVIWPVNAWEFQPLFMTRCSNGHPRFEHVVKNIRSLSSDEIIRDREQSPFDRNPILSLNQQSIALKINFVHKFSKLKKQDTDLSSSSMTAGSDGLLVGKYCYYKGDQNVFDAWRSQCQVLCIHMPLNSLVMQKNWFWIKSWPSNACLLGGSEGQKAKKCLGSWRYLCSVQFLQAFQEHFLSNLCTLHKNYSINTTSRQMKYRICFEVKERDLRRWTSIGYFCSIFVPWSCGDVIHSSVHWLWQMDFPW